MKVQVLRNYIDFEAFKNFYKECFKECLTAFDDEDAAFTEMFDEDYVDDFAFHFAFQANKDMRRYINGDNQRMWGNFANIREDYEDKFDKRFDVVVQKLNDGVEDDVTKEFIEWTLSWFVYAFGTFGLKYNISEHLNAELADYQYELEHGIR